MGEDRTRDINPLEHAQLEDLATRKVDAYFDKVQEAKRAEEARRDQLLLLIVGGAFSLSFPFVTSLRERLQLIHVGVLIGAWSVWALALFGALVCYWCSIRAHEHVLLALARHDYDVEHFKSKWSRAVEPLNLSATVLAVAGFVLFGWFAIANLQHQGGQSNGQSQEESKKESGYPQGGRETPSGR